MRKKATRFDYTDQLSLFDVNEKEHAPLRPSLRTVEVERTEVTKEELPFKTQEEYRRWIKHLINKSLKSMD